ncbi:MAG TPA: ferrous iron transport protein A [Caldilineae bacterium]|jgi:Fe2+ transport system protein FeoA|nr:ferrous iron transport protein A [Caldilineae bacterium]
MIYNHYNCAPIPEQIVDLASLPTGARGVVRSLRGGRGFLSRLATMGFTAGTEVTVLQNYGHGPIITLVRGTRVALGRGEARHILVSVVR